MIVLGEPDHLTHQIVELLLEGCSARCYWLYGVVDVLFECQQFYANKQTIFTQPKQKMATPGARHKKSVLVG